MTATLTDRYVWAAGRSVPEDQRDEFARELRERIGDATDALHGAGHSPADAERAALTELGDPAALAASYADRTLHLIGPRYYLAWLRLLKLVLAIAVPAASGAVLLANLLADTPVGEAIMDSLSVALSVATGVAFWMTLVFALVERYSDSVPTVAWTPEQLPELPEGNGAGRVGELVGSVVFLTLFVGVILWQRTNSVVSDSAGDPVPFLDPDLWSFWIPWFIGLAVVEAVFAVLVFRHGWNWTLAVMNIVLNAAFAIPAIWLLRSGQLVTDAYLDAIEWPWGNAGDVVLTIVTITVVAIALWDVIEGIVKAARASGTIDR